MAKKRSGISISSIIFMIIAYNLFFGDNDSNDNKVKIVDQPKAVVEETTNKKGIDLTKLKEEGIGVLNQVIEKGTEILKDTSSEKSEPVKPTPVPKPEKKEKEMIAQPEKEDNLKPLNEKPKTTEMRKL